MSRHEAGSIKQPEGELWVTACNYCRPRGHQVERGLIAAWQNYCRLIWTYQHMALLRHGDNIGLIFGLINV